MAHIVKTSFGWIRGVQEGRVLAFRGIPYAQPPIGPLRFRPPHKPLAWSGVRDAGSYGPAPMQVGSPVSAQMGLAPPEVHEDCLSLNIWTPAADDAQRPVLVWLYGGAWVTGAGSLPLYNGARLAARGEVVVVTLNYRLGLFGFLRGTGVCGDALNTTGNEGLLDQIAALEWVRDEIAGFGGDPQNVTVWGQSAGARSAALLTVMPRARGLVHKVIQQSGGLALRQTLTSADGVMHRLLKAMGLTPAQADRLREVPAATLLDLQQRLTPRTGGHFYGPVADGELIPTDPFEAVATGASRGIPLLCGTNLDEMKFFRALDPAVEGLDNAGLLDRCRTLVAQVGHAERVLETYRAARLARGAETSATELWFALASDHTYRTPIMRQAEQHAAHTPATYAYLFTWRSPAQSGRLGAAHCMEIPFVFGRLDDPGMGSFTGQGSAVQQLSEQMMDAWIAFARTGNPATAALPVWPAYTANRRTTMVFDESVTVVDAPMEAERAIWTSVQKAEQGPGADRQ
ncbi:MAG: carboxylesterase/lipase family protein [candidate division KSB1 bacterium]|nr:carboxylesterase/lipase family protein [candidate division KSB1 bacterium]